MALDILDNIQREHHLYLTMKPDFERLQTNRSYFLLDSITWKQHYQNLSDKTFNWQEVKYSELADEIIKFSDVFPDKTGVYLLVVRPDDVINNAPRYVYYVGIAGSTNTGNPLSERIRNYFQLSHLKKRNHVEILINKYYSNLYISFSELELAPKELEEVEKSLIGYYGTHILANKDDAPIELKPQQKAFNL